MKQLLILCISVLLTTACAKVQPTACFTINTADTIHINTRVDFDASCSKDAAYYKWTMSDTTMGSVTTYRTFTTTGNYTVLLHVENGSKSSETSHLIVVNP